ncbi:MAG: HD domain-containing phosphohydrolase [Planctomycetota bacterium]
MERSSIGGVVSSTIRIDKLTMLLQVSSALMREKDIDRLLKLIIENATTIIGAERSSIFLMDYDTNELYTRVAQLKEVSEIRFPADKGIAGFAVKHSKLVNIPDAYKDERFNPAVDRQTGWRTRNILTAPMLNHKSETVGVLQVLNKKRGSFNMEDEALIMALAAQAAVAVENAQLYQEQELTLKSFLKTMGSAIDARDPTTAGHSERVARYAINLGRELGFNETELKMLDYSAALHDVGKIGVPDRVLLKPDKLTPEEFDEMKRHAVRTKEILDNMFFARELREIPHIASTHHEKLDGSGYPLGLKSDQMTVSAKILAIADVYDALVAQDRPYKKAMTHEQAIGILEQGRDSKFDGALLDLFKEKKLYLIERRRFTRFALAIPFEYKQPKAQVSDKLRSETVNISASGLLMGSKRLLPLGTEVEMFIRLAERPARTTDIVQSGRDYHLLGKVVRSEQKFAKQTYYLGVAFFGLTEPEQNDLSAVLAQYK